MAVKIRGMNGETSVLTMEMLESGNRSIPQVHLA
jgi:thymidine phosphorylase